jgi:hemolysin III
MPLHFRLQRATTLAPLVLDAVGKDLPVTDPLEMDSLARSPAEELANTVTHGIGWVLSVGGAAVLIFRAASSGDAWRISGCAIFAVALIGVYAASTLSHATQAPWRRRFRILDQGLIYLLIVGTFTPLALEFLRIGWGWLLLAIMWAVALVGFVSKIWFAHRIDAMAVWSYVLLGWLPILPAAAYIGRVPAAVLWWVLIGGLCYTVGTIFLVLDVRRFHFHAIWHLLVVAGSACHYSAVFLYVAAGR